MQAEIQSELQSELQAGLHCADPGNLLARLIQLEHKKRKFEMNCSFRRRSGEIRAAFRFWSTGRGEFTGDLRVGDFVFAILFYSVLFF